jgi:hypothetical protein
VEKIEIDWDIHQRIEAERRGFNEPPYLALRRLLGLPEPAAAPSVLVSEPQAEQAIGEGVPWSEDGVVVPHGCPARMEYLHGSQVYEGQFLNGRLVAKGHSFETLSAAASALAVTKQGTRTSLNGWLYWKVKLPGDTEWRSLGDMRPQAVKSTHLSAEEVL